MDSVQHFFLLGIFLGIVSIITGEVVVYGDEAELEHKNDLRKYGKPHIMILHVQTAFCQIAFQPPAPQANGRFVAGLFRRKLANS